jgi:putative membrane protein
MLKQEDVLRIEQAIQSTEVRTSSEIAVCMLRASGDDRGIAALAGVLVLAVAGGLGGFLWPEISIYGLFAVALAVGIVVFLLVDCFDLGLKLLPAHSVAQDARRSARAVFLDRGLDTTPQRNAVLLFISRAERYVEILPDRGLAAAVPPQRWANIVTSFQEVARQKGMAEAAADAVIRIGAVCAGPFPVDAANPDLISNRPIAD